MWSGSGVGTARRLSAAVVTEDGAIAIAVGGRFGILVMIGWGRALGGSAGLPGIGRRFRGRVSLDPFGRPRFLFVAAMTPDSADTDAGGADSGGKGCVGVRMGLLQTSRARLTAWVRSSHICEKKKQSFPLFIQRELASLLKEQIQRGH